MQGANDYGQMAFGKELGEKVPFFPEFRKIDMFGGYSKVLDVALSVQSSHVLTRDGKLFSVGCNECGQLANDEMLLTKYDFVEVHYNNKTKFTKIAAGAFHLLAKDEEGKVFSWGQNKKGQLGYKLPNPKERLSSKIKEIVGGL